MRIANKFSMLFAFRFMAFVDRLAEFLQYKTGIFCVPDTDSLVEYFHQADKPIDHSPNEWAFDSDDSIRLHKKIPLP